MDKKKYSNIKNWIQENDTSAAPNRQGMKKNYNANF